MGWSADADGLPKEAGVACFAHIGGFVFGVLYALVIRNSVQREILAPKEV